GATRHEWEEICTRSTVHQMHERMCMIEHDQQAVVQRMNRKGPSYLRTCHAPFRGNAPGLEILGTHFSARGVGLRDFHTRGLVTSARAEHERGESGERNELSTTAHWTGSEAPVLRLEKYP